ncbi:MAG TPA: N-acetylglucosamine/diacetylchitobiose ABC transporter substrate-binding protein [Rugosimonospora sp.]|nr:N-acetylglucosamine/diacetylchitobiose ABC transporter substrate-binding protein [Rugosimonospora sp.]
MPGETRSPALTRRALLGRTAALGLLAGPATGLLDACAGGGSTSGAASTVSASPRNPFGVKDGAALDVVIFDGGLGQEYVTYAEQRYGAKYPASRARISHQGIQKIKTTLQPRFANGTPPDLIDNSGADQIPNDGLYSQGQLTDLTPLLDAPSYDDPTVKVRDTLLPGTVDVGSFDGKMYELNYAFTVSGIWYSSSLFRTKGWTYPDTWDGFLALCATIKQSGLSPWIHQGKYPDYMTTPILDLAFKAGGAAVAIAVDNLEPNAWSQEALRNAVEAVYQLVARGYVYPGAEGLTHLESQTKWNQGQAAFIPCGSWLPNEQKDQTPSGFDMVVVPMPSLSTSDTLPYGAVRASAGEPFIVPARAKNRAGGMELLRTMLSRDAAARFATLTNSLSCVKGSGASLTGPTIRSENAALTAAGTHLISWKYQDWYADLHTATQNATGELMANRYKPADFIKAVQAAADKVARDSTVKKFTRTS